MNSLRYYKRKNWFKSFILLGLLALGISCQNKTQKLQTISLSEILVEFHHPNSERVLIAAHRASNPYYPENSLASIKYAIKTGIDIVEIDIRTTKDGKMVLMHDETINRTTNGEGKISEYSYAELQEFTLNKKWRDSLTHHIPLLKDVFALAYGKIILDLDLKEVIIKPLVQLVQESNTRKQVLFFDGSYQVLDSILYYDSTLLLMPRAHSLDDVKEIISKYHPAVIHIDPSFYTPEVVETIKENGGRIWINALGWPDIKAYWGFKKIAYNPLIKYKANIIQTDLPLDVHLFLKQKNLR